MIEGHKCMFKFFKRRFYVWWANIDHLSLSKCPRMEILCTFLFRTRRGIRAKQALLMKIFVGWIRGRNDKRFLKWCAKIQKIVIVGHKCMFKFFKQSFHVWWANIVHVRVKNIIKNRGSIMSKNGNIMSIFVQNEEGDKG